MGKDANLNGVLKWLRNRSRDTETAKRLIQDYGKILEPSQKNLKIIAGMIQSDFSSFVKFYKKYAGNHPRTETYDEWWSRKNLDGSFAYNGVTDDF